MRAIPSPAPDSTTLLSWDSEAPVAEMMIRSVGRLRSPDPALIEADNDLEAASVWLAEYADSPNTLAAYRKEVERLLIWAARVRHKPLSALMADDYLAYRAFLADPQPRELWCGPKVSRTDPRWRPFVGSLSERSILQAMAIINTLLAYLVNARYLIANPLAINRKRRQPAAKAAVSERALDRNLWEHVGAHIEGWPRETPLQVAGYERARWLLSFMYATGPRANEVASHTMGSVVLERGRRDRWWWQVRGKGGRVDRVPLADSVVQAMIRYRQHLGLPAIPAQDEPTPLVCRLGRLDRNKPLTRAGVYRIVKEILLGAAADIEGFDAAGAAVLRRASTHWLRHTAITHLADRVNDVRVIQRFARHANLSTTSGYLHYEEEAFHTGVTAAAPDSEPDL